MKKICVESHFNMKEYWDYLYSRKEIPRRELIDDGKFIRDWLTPDLSLTQPADSRFMKDYGDINNLEDRLRDMDEAGIDMQVLSFAHPTVQDLGVSDAIIWSKKSNNALAEAVKMHPDRFAGFARIPLQDPSAAVEELERAIGDLGLHGIKIDSNVGGEYLDEKKFRMVFAKIADFDVPIYLHPKEPSPGMIKPYLAYPGLPGSMWGYGAETGLHAVRLICSGLFDEYPGLKIILGHMGEALPFWQWRLNLTGPEPPEGLKKRPGEYVKENFFAATSGNFSQPALMCAYLALGADRILFAVDYMGGGPEVSMEAVRFMEAAPICDNDKEKIYHLNAEKLLNLS